MRLLGLCIEVLGFQIILCGATCCITAAGIERRNEAAWQEYAASLSKKYFAEHATGTNPPSEWSFHDELHVLRSKLGLVRAPVNSRPAQFLTWLVAGCLTAALGEFIRKCGSLTS